MVDHKEAPRQNDRQRSVQTVRKHWRRGERRRGKWLPESTFLLLSSSSLLLVCSDSDYGPVQFLFDEESYQLLTNSGFVPGLFLFDEGVALSTGTELDVTFPICGCRKLHVCSWVTHGLGSSFTINEALCVGALRTTQVRSRAVGETSLVTNLNAVPMATTWFDDARAVGDTVPFANLSAVPRPNRSLQ